MSIAHALFLTLILLNYERQTRLVMVLRAPLGPMSCECAGTLAQAVCRWLSEVAGLEPRASPPTGHEGDHEGAVPMGPPAPEGGQSRVKH